MSSEKKRRNRAKGMEQPARPELTREETSLLMYLETRAVDHGGMVDPRRMNARDFEIIDGWKAEGFVAFERLKMRDGGPVGDSTHATTLSDEAWSAAHAARKSRGLMNAMDRTPEIPVWKKASKAGGAR